MLKKLLKYDLKYMFKVLNIFYVLSIIFAIVELSIKKKTLVKIAANIDSI